MTSVTSQRCDRKIRFPSFLLCLAPICTLTMKVTLVCLTTLFSVVALATTSSAGFVPKQQHGKREHTVTFFVLRKKLQHESKHVSSDAFLGGSEESFFDNKHFKLEKETLREMDETDS
jgi:hypothetical protein